MRATTVAGLSRAERDDPALPGEESELVEALRRGDESVFLELVDRYQDALLRLAALYFDGPAAEAAVRGAWLGLLRDLDNLAADASPKVLVFRALLDREEVRERRGVPSIEPEGTRTTPTEPSVDPARFQQSDHLGGAGHWASPPRHWSDAAAGTPPSAAVRRCLRAAIAGLALAQREVITLRDVEGWTAGDVCDLLGTSEEEQRTLLHRARSRLWAVLEGHFAPQ